PGNTLINLSNLLDPILLISLSWLAARLKDSDKESPAFLQWQMRLKPLVGMAAVAIGSGFAIGYAADELLFWTIAGVALGIGIGVFITKRIAHGQQKPVENHKDYLINPQD